MRVESLIESDELGPGERWVTINGSAVKINADGEVVAGPGALKGKDLDGREEKQSFKFGEVIPKERAEKIVAHIRGGDPRSKNQGRISLAGERLKGDMVMSEIPTNLFDDIKDEDYGDYKGFLRHTTNADRVAHYTANRINTPIVVVVGRSGRPSVSDGGHRFVAALNRGDKTIPALVPKELHDKLHSVKESTFRESRTPTLDDLRTASETKLQRILAGLDKRHRQQLEQAIADAGSVRDVPEIVWQQIQFEIEEETAAAIILMMVAADEWTDDELRRQGLDADDMDTVSRYQRYSTTAARRAQDMAQQTTLTARMKLARKIEDAMLDPNRGGTGELTKRGIKDALDDVFNKSRRETLATDQTTGSFSTGQKGAAERLGGDGASTTAGQKVTIELRWQTELDDRVCPRCSPLHEQPEEVWGKVFPNGPGPEAHPNCRCFLRSVVVMEPT